MDTLYGSQARDKIWSLVKDIKVALMATFDDAGHIFHARPMMARTGQDGREFDGTLWFFAGADTRRARELTTNPRALLTYADPSKQSYVSICGQASIERDRSVLDRLWTNDAETWFPDGKDDPNLVLIRFDAEGAEFWDAPGPIVSGLAYIKAMVFGERPHLGRVGKVSLSH